MDSVSSGGEVRIQSGDVTALVAPEYADVFDPDWFDPEFWRGRAVSVSSGGRGSAWFVERSPEHWVLRRFMRGGAVGKLISDSYIYSGEARIRSYVEFRLLRQLHGMGLPVPTPVAAMYQRRGLFYSTAIIIERFHCVRPLGDVAPALDENRWLEVGRVIRRFHDAGVYHADLNCFNILVGESSIYLIDFDKGELRSSASPLARWKEDNLNRLKRSLNKVLGSEVESQWPVFLAGYNNAISP